MLYEQWLRKSNGWAGFILLEGGGHVDLRLRQKEDGLHFIMVT
uniref:Uncharacterized protein n=1 Tax=Arabidopsis thaliana TaxID=3702 RepID=Q0WSZ5_ARATH|nr:hypothetical protein [Arabidopsis thaliana]